MDNKSDDICVNNIKHISESSNDISLYVTIKELEKKLNMTNLQDYIPIVDNSNNNTPLNKPLISLSNIEVSDTLSNVIIQNNKEIFCKFAPLLDPIKYMVGKYDVNQMYILPSHNGKLGIPLEKINRKMNSAYVDAMFCSISKENKDFINGIEYNGCLIGIKNNFQVSVEDDIQILSESEFFHDHNDKLFTLDYILQEQLNGSSKNRERINIEDNFQLSENEIQTLTTIEPEIDDNLTISDVSFVENIIECISKSATSETIKLDENNEDTSSEITEEDNSEEYQYDNDVSECESECDDASEGESERDENNNDWEDMSDSSNMSDESSDCEIRATIKRFPVAIIMLEKCDNTLKIT